MAVPARNQDFAWISSGDFSFLEAPTRERVSCTYTCAEPLADQGSREVKAALEKAQKTWELAQTLSHQPTQTWAALGLPWIHLDRREGTLAQAQAETAITLGTEKEQIQPLSHATIFKGYALAEQGQGEEGLLLIQEGLKMWQTTGGRVFLSMFLIWQAQVNGWLGREDEGLAILAEAQTFIDKTGERVAEAELYRLKGELTLQKGARDWVLGAGSPSPQAPSFKPQVPSSVAEEAEGYFLKAIDLPGQKDGAGWIQTLQGPAGH